MADVMRWFGFCDSLLEIFREAADIKLPTTPTGVAETHVVAYTLLARMTSNFSGTITLARAALLVEARILARSCIENSFCLAALHQRKGGFVADLMKADAANRKQRGESLLSRKSITLDRETRLGLQATLKEMRNTKISGAIKTPKDLSKDGKFNDLYVAYAQLSSDSGHPSIASLERYLVGRVTHSDG